jgi:predicted enzyme related to lactoylglutathione lyase
MKVDADGDIEIRSSDGSRVGLLIQLVSEAKAGKNSIHLDLSTASVEDQESYVQQLLALGARHVDVGQTSEDKHVVLADPEGNEFCVLEPGNSFVDYDSRLGSITCDGSRAVGLFWSAVFGWPLVWDQDGETAIRAAQGTGPFITWGPPVPAKERKNRLHLDIAPSTDVTQRDEVQRIMALGATRANVGQAGDEGWVVLADPDGNEFCVLTPR